MRSEALFLGVWIGVVGYFIIRFMGQLHEQTMDRLREVQKFMEPLVLGEYVQKCHEETQARLAKIEESVTSLETWDKLRRQGPAKSSIKQIGMEPG